VDAGSAGAFTLEGLRRHIIERSQVRISAFLNISCIGLVAWDYELTNIELADVALFEMVANRHRDILCGVKVRMGATTVGSNGVVSWWQEGIRRNRCAAAQQSPQGSEASITYLGGICLTTSGGRGGG
jgi:predicted amidohydrolase